MRASSARIRTTAACCMIRNTIRCGPKPQELGFSIGIHGGSESGQPTLAMDRFTRGGAVRHFVAHTFEMMAAATSLIMCGVCDRFPRSSSRSWNRAAAGWPVGSIGWIAISTTSG